jgi:type I restriction enzyme S subunit
LNLKLLRGVELPVPPLTEQRRIVAELDALQAEVDALKRLQAETAAELDALLPILLDRAFRGQLVLQEPTDEPAEKLLERILDAKKD